jgi:hypothetical protein
MQATGTETIVRSTEIVFKVPNDMTEPLWRPLHIKRCIKQSGPHAKITLVGAQRHHVS